MNVYVIKQTTYEVEKPEQPRCVFYWGKPRRLWDSPYHVEGFKKKGAAERAIQLDMKNSINVVQISEHVSIENKHFVNCYEVVEIEN